MTDFPNATMMQERSKQARESLYKDELAVIFSAIQSAADEGDYDVILDNTISDYAVFYLKKQGYEVDITTPTLPAISWEIPEI